eukprot:2584919-Prymnesium_polylepis.1
MSYQIYNTHATASSSCTQARYTSLRAHHRLLSRDAARGSPAVTGVRPNDEGSCYSQIWPDLS